jgi:hypothetical protein
VQEEVCDEVPVRDLFLVLRNLKKQKIRIRIRIQRLSWGWRMEKRPLVGTICTLHLGTRMLQEQLYRDLGETGGIVMLYKL